VVRIAAKAFFDEEVGALKAGDGGGPKRREKGLVGGGSNKIRIGGWSFTLN